MAETGGSFLKTLVILCIIGGLIATGLWYVKNSSDKGSIAYTAKEKILEIKEKYIPFKDCFFKPITFKNRVNSFHIPYQVTKSELLESLTNVSNESTLCIGTDEDSYMEIRVYEPRQETETEITERIYNLLIHWASSSDYHLIKTIYTLKKENSELKKKLHLP